MTKKYNDFSKPNAVSKEYKLPISLLDSPYEVEGWSADDENVKHAIIKALGEYGISATVSKTEVGLRVTRYTVTTDKLPEAKRKTDQIAKHLSDTLFNECVRICPILLNKCEMVFEIPNGRATVLSIRELIESDKFRMESTTDLAVIGRAISGEDIFANVSYFPNTFIAGNCGMGKSVSLNSFIISMLYKFTSDEVNFIMIDPKRVDLRDYEGIPHLLAPIITDPARSLAALEWASNEIKRRIKILTSYGFYSAIRYNDAVRNGKIDEEPLPKIFVIIDEITEVIRAFPEKASGLIEEILRYSPLGIHLIATDQPSSLTSLSSRVVSLFANRIALRISSEHISKVLVGEVGAEKLTTRGDMIISSSILPSPVRVQGAYVSNDEVKRVTDYIKNNSRAAYSQEACDSIDKMADDIAKAIGSTHAENILNATDSDDESFNKAVDFAITRSRISISHLQKRFGIDYSTAESYIDRMKDMGFISTPPKSELYDVTVPFWLWPKDY